MVSPESRRGAVPSTVLASAVAVLATALAGCGGGERPPPSTPSAQGRIDSPGNVEATQDRTDAAARERWRPEDRKSSARTGRVAGYVTLAVGVQATAVALVTSGMMLHYDGVRSDNCDADKRCNAEGTDANATLRGLGGWNAGAWAVGVAGIGVGTLLLLLHPSRASRAEAAGSRAAITGDPSGAGPGLGLRGSF